VVKLSIEDWLSIIFDLTILALSGTLFAIDFFKVPRAHWELNAALV
jgi:hypothetical protein